MADFRTGIDPVNYNAGSAPTPVVDRSSAVGLDLFSDVVKSVVPGLLQRDAERRKAQASLEYEQAKNSALSGFAEQQLKLADAVESGQMSSRAARMRMRTNYTAAISNSPALIGDLAQVQKDIVSTSGLGKVVADGTDQEQFALAAEKEATLNGWVPPHLNDDQRAEATQKYLNFKRSQDEMAQQQAQVSLQTAKINQQTALYSRDSARLTLAQKERSERSRVAIGNMADAYNYKFNNDLTEIVARRDRGEIDDVAATQMIQQQYAIVQQTVTQIGSDAPTDYVNNMTNPMKLRYQNALDYVSGKIQKEVLDNRNSNIIAQQKLTLLGDPEVAQTVAVSSLFQNASPMLLSTIDAKVVSKISQNMKPNAGKPVDIMPDNDNDKQTTQSYLDMVKQGLTSVNSGAAIDKDKTSQELDVHVSQMLNSVNAYGPVTSRPQDFNQVVDFLADPAFGKYTSSKGGVPADTAAQAKNVLSQQYEQAVLPLIQQEYENARIVDVKSSPTQALSGQATTVVSDPTKVIKPVFSGSGVIFQADPNASVAIKRKAQDLNKSVSPVLNRLIRMSAHLNGNTDYRAAYQQNYEALFGINEGNNANQ